MGKQNYFHSQLLLLHASEHFSTISAGIECRCPPADWIPAKIGIHRHIAVRRIELRKPGDLTDSFRLPSSSSQVPKRLRIQIENRSDAIDNRIVKLTAAQLAHLLRIQSGLFRE